jgi:hypothetical protein
MPWIMIADVSDYRLSLNQFYGGVFMASAMVFFESLFFMPSWPWLLTMFILMMCSALCIRYQVGIDDKMYLRDMIPHHSMAVLTSRPRVHRARNPQILKLAETILSSQLAEIHQMKTILLN